MDYHRSKPYWSLKQQQSPRTPPDMYTQDRGKFRKALLQNGQAPFISQTTAPYKAIKETTQRIFRNILQWGQIQQAAE